MNPHSFARLAALCACAGLAACVTPGGPGGPAASSRVTVTEEAYVPPPPKPTSPPAAPTQPAQVNDMVEALLAVVNGKTAKPAPDAAHTLPTPPGPERQPEKADKDKSDREKDGPVPRSAPRQKIVTEVNHDAAGGRPLVRLPSPADSVGGKPVPRPARGDADKGRGDSGGDREAAARPPAPRGGIGHFDPTGGGARVETGRSPVLGR